MLINENFIKIPETYLFSEVAARLKKYREGNPSRELIRMDIGDVTLPLPEVVTNAMHKAVEEMRFKDTFRGYGPEQGYSFLREVIAQHDYQQRGIKILPDEIFISDGAKSDLGNLSDIYSHDSVVALTNPGYPVYSDSSVMAGMGGEHTSEGTWSRFIYMRCTEANDFKPLLPEKHADVLFLCSPSNPTGVTFTREELSAWVDYARRHKSLIIYDSAYEAYIRDTSIPRSIYEIPGAEEVAIEVRSFSKTAGFTGMRCGYTIVPHSLYGFDSRGREIELHKLWNRRQSTKFNGASYIIQRGAEALYTPDGEKAIKAHTDIYLSNANMIRETLQGPEYQVYGGENSPYVWVHPRNCDDSWKFFDKLLTAAGVSCTPGIGFGSCGAGYVRFTGFNTPEKTKEAMKRIKSIK